MISSPSPREDSEDEITEMMEEASRLDALFQRQSPHVLYSLVRIRLLPKPQADELDKD
jgi:hypothetical protein